MTTIKAKYYTDELVEWTRNIIYYICEINYLELKLAEAIRQNTMPNIAAKVEVHQNEQNTARRSLSQLQLQMTKQESALKTDSTFINDVLINTQTERLQNQLRQNMLQAEKEYAYRSDNCYNVFYRSSVCY